MSDTTTGTPPMIGESLTADAFAAYVASYQFGSVAPDRIIVHHTFRPDQRQWRGRASMQGMQTYYRSLGWSSAPHIYVADDGIWLFTPLKDVGIHAGPGNANAEFRAHWDTRYLQWYSIGVEIVWNGEVSRPTGATLSNAVAVLAALCRKLQQTPQQAITFHRQWMDTTCPGKHIQAAWLFPLIDQALGSASPPATPSPHITSAAPIIAAPRATLDQAAKMLCSDRARLLRRNVTSYTDHDISTVILPAYFDIAQSVGVDPCFVVAQMIHETGYLSSWWCDRPRRNPAGIGVTGVSRTSKPASGAWAMRDGQWVEGVSFDSWVNHAIPAHIGRILAYAVYPERRTVDQNRLIRVALGYRALPSALQGAAPTIDGFRGTWAVPGTEYPQRIVEIMNVMRSL